MRRGFTLLEVLISIMIFVLGVTAIIPLFAVGTTSHRRAIEQTESALLAARIFAEIQQDFYDTNPKNITDASFADIDTIFSYDVEFIQFDPMDEMRTAFIVKVTIKWGEPPGQATETFETILLRKMLR